MEIEGLKQSIIDRPGFFKAWPFEWTFTEARSGAAALVFHFSIVSEWLPETRTWGDWPQGYYVELRAWVNTRDGKLNETAMKMLADAGLWNGDYLAIDGPPPQVVAIVRVDAEEYQGRTYLRGGWADPDGPEPRSGQSTTFQPANRSLLESYRAKFGPQARALVGGQRGTPPAPPPPSAPQAHANGAGVASAPAAPPPPPPPTNRPPFQTPPAAPHQAPAQSSPPQPPWPRAAPVPNQAIMAPTEDGRGMEPADMSRFDTSGVEPPF